MRSLLPVDRIFNFIGESQEVSRHGYYLWRRVNGNLNLSRAIGDLRYKGNQSLKPADQIITAEPDIVEVSL